MVFCIKSQYASEDIESSLDQAVDRMCQLVKEWPGAFKLTDEEEKVYATAFRGDPFIWAGDVFEENGKRYGVACQRYFENIKTCPECSTQIPTKMLSCPQCAFLKCVSNPAGEPRKKGKRGDYGDNFDFYSAAKEDS